MRTKISSEWNKEVIRILLRDVLRKKKKQKRLGKTSLITLMRISWISSETSWNARGQLGEMLNEAPGIW